MTEQSAQLQSVEQALQDKGIDYVVKNAIRDDRYKDTEITTITVEVYDTGDME